MSTTLAPTETTNAIPTYELKGGPEIEPTFNATCGFQQRPISITLDGPTIFALAVALVVFIHFLGSHPTEILVSLTPVFLLVRNDYYNFINLGPGGTPSTFQGYLRISWLRLWALRDPFSAPKTRSQPCAEPGHLASASSPVPSRAEAPRCWHRAAETAGPAWVAAMLPVSQEGPGKAERPQPGQVWHRAVLSREARPGSLRKTSLADKLPGRNLPCSRL